MAHRDLHICQEVDLRAPRSSPEFSAALQGFRSAMWARGRIDSDAAIAAAPTVVATVAATVPPAAVITAVPPDFLPSNNLPLQISPASKYPKPSK